MGKLVRDHIPKIIKDSGEHPAVYILPQEEYRRALHRKLYEETNELIEADEEKRLMELSDIYEVITCLAEEIGHSEADLINAAYMKRKTNGSFKNRFYLVAVGKVDLSPVLDRFGFGWPKMIDCGQGWHGIIHDIDKELSSIDPDYTIQQIKEKFGGLRFYFMMNTENTELHENIQKLIDIAEDKSYDTCQITGKVGKLCKKGRYYMTLSEEARNSHGFEVVNGSKKFD